MTNYSGISLTLGSVVDNKILDILNQLKRFENEIKIYKERLNSHISLKRSLALTFDDLSALGIDLSDLTTKIKNLDKKIQKSAIDYLKKRVENEDKILELEENLSKIDKLNSIESPIDFSKSEIKQLPLASDSLNLDVQFFSYEGSDSGEDQTMSNIGDYVKEATSGLEKESDKLAQASINKINQQKRSHNISGTIIIVASCTHKNVAVIEPLILDIDKSLEVFNQGKKQKIASSLNSIKQLVDNEKVNTESVNIVSGVKYGSSFIGMVHLLKEEDLSENPSSEEIKKLQEKLKLGGWLENSVGGVGVDKGIVDQVKDIIHTHKIKTHVSLLTTGVIPSITSNMLDSGVVNLIKSGPNQAKEHLSKKQNNNEINTIDTANNESKEVNRHNNILSMKESGLINELNKIDSHNNSIIDMNSLMTSFENYVSMLNNSNFFLGSPIGYFIKPISLKKIGEEWLKKYYPNNNNNNKLQ